MVISPRRPSWQPSGEKSGALPPFDQFRKGQIRALRLLHRPTHEQTRYKGLGRREIMKYIDWQPHPSFPDYQSSTFRDSGMDFVPR